MRASLLLTPLVLAAIGCATVEETPTSFPVPPPVVAEAPMPVVQYEPRELVPGKPTKKGGRTVKPTTVNAVTIFNYSPDRVYPIATSPGYFTSILLEPGEQMPGKAAIGDPAPEKWRIDKTTFGSPKGSVVALLIKPGDVGLKTNVFIATNRRAYQLLVTSYKNPAMDIVRWQFPEPQAPELPTTVVVQNDTRLDPTSFNFDYKISLASGDKPRWMPVRVFDAGPKRFIEFPGQLGNQVSAPALFSIDSNGNASPLAFRPIGKFFEVDGRINVAELRLNGSVVRITKGNG